MAKIASIIADMFEDSEYIEPAKAFQKAGHQVVTVGLEAGLTVKGKKNNTPVQIDLSLAEADPKTFDALLIPGGYSPDKLRVHEEAVNFAKAFMAAAKPVFSICHGPQLLISAKSIEGRKITGWKSIVEDLKYAGGIYIDQEVVVDGNLVSSRSPDDLPAFIGACLAMLAK